MCYKYFYSILFYKKFKCPVCFSKERSLAIFNCGHGVCYDCLISIFRKKYFNKCPICRSFITRHETGIIFNKNCINCNKLSRLTKCKNCNLIKCFECYTKDIACVRCDNNLITNIYIDY